MYRINKLLSVILLLTIAIVYTLLFFMLTPTHVGVHGFEDVLSGSAGFVKALLLSIFTILGIIAKIIYDEIEKTSDAVFNILQVAQKAVNSRQAWLAFIASPVVILAFYKTLNDIDNSILLSLMSFQNGFFFKSVFNKKDNNTTHVYRKSKIKE